MGNNLRPKDADFLPSLWKVVKPSGNTQAQQMLTKNTHSMEDNGRRLWTLEHAEADLQEGNESRDDLTVEAAGAPCR